ELDKGCAEKENEQNPPCPPIQQHGPTRHAIRKRNVGHNKNEERRLTTAHRAMKRCMLGISLGEHIRCEEIRRRTGVRDEVAEYRKQKLRWASHLARINDDRWTSAVAEWYPMEQKRHLGRPPRRWRDEIEQEGGKTWQRRARSRAK
ncbi:Putative uncharacterized transposon-derived protein F52C9.6, partial [Toxocara canis]